MDGPQEKDDGKNCQPCKSKEDDCDTSKDDQDKAQQ